MTHICPDDLVNLNRLGGGVYECPKCHECFQESYGGVLKPTGRRMEMNMRRSATCPYCDSRVAMSQSVLGNHRAVGGVCDGSNRVVTTMDSYGRAVLMVNFADLKVGQKVKALNVDSGREEDAEITATDYGSGTVTVKFRDGSTAVKHFTKVKA